MAEFITREPRALSTSETGHLVAPSISRPRSSSNAASCHSNLTTVDNSDEEVKFGKRKLSRQQTFVVDAELSFLDLLKGMFWRNNLKRKIESSVKPVYTKGPDEEMFDHNRSPFDLDVHVAPKINSTETHTIRCWFDTCCFQGNIISKDFVTSLGFYESDYVALTPREEYGGQMMNETIHSVEAAILLSWHHNTGPKYRDMRFLISSTLDSHRMIIGTRSIVKHNLLSPPAFMNDATPRKNVHKRLPEKDKTLGDLQHDLSEAEMGLANLESALKKAKGSMVEQLQLRRDEAKHKHDMLGLRVEMKGAELKNNMKEEDKKEYIKKLEQEISKGQHAEAERKAKLSQDSKPAQTKATGSRQKQPGGPAVVDEHL